MIGKTIGYTRNLQPIPVIIPAYEPDSRLILLLKDLQKRGISDVVLVNDGSGDGYREIFDQARIILAQTGGTLLAHELNQGKGRALKTGFAYVLAHYPDCIGVVTADSDGQHTSDCILAVMKRLREKPNALVLGVRQFDGSQVPWKSRLGNKITMKVFGYVTGIRVSDTQTGLRGIPRSFMRDLLKVPGERFEFETRMLLETSGKYDIEEVKIRTIYDSKDNHQTHFDPVRDSIRIYRIIGKKLIIYLFSSISSFVIDIGLFIVFCSLLKGKTSFYIVAATVLARVLSAAWNYTLNYKIVFCSKKNAGRSALKYIQLAIAQMVISAALVSVGAAIFPVLPETAVKIVVDTILFLAGYYIQNRYIF